MGVFAVIGLIIVGLSVYARSPWMAVLGLLIFGIGVAGDINGY